MNAADRKEKRRTGARRRGKVTPPAARGEQATNGQGAPPAGPEAAPEGADAVDGGAPAPPAAGAGSWWVYLVRCRDGSLYAGCTNDLARRVLAHNAGRGAAYTRSRGPVVLAWWEAQPDRSAALRREWAIKQLSRRQKLALVADEVTPDCLTP